MKTVYKYPLDGDGDGTPRPIKMPTNAKVIHVDQQGKGFFLWAEHEFVPEAILPVSERYFEIIGTGGRVPNRSTYVGTIMDDPFVWHVYETTQES